MKWPPDKFWESTFYEVSCAYIGHARANGLGKWEVQRDGWSGAMIEEHRQEVDELMAKFGQLPAPPKPKSKPKPKPIAGGGRKHV